MTPSFTPLFTPGWVAALLAATDHLTRPALLPGALPGHARVLPWVAELFTRFAPSDVPRIRAWNAGRPRYTAAEELVRLADQAALSLEERLASATRGERYCVTFNGLTEWSARFDHEMRVGMLEPLFRELGAPPRAGCDYYLFVGNYGFTPFGVHADADDSLLWHLGPGRKTAYVWPHADYVALTGGAQNTQDYAALLPHAQRFELAPGDLLFIPMTDFHILETPDLSATLGLTLFPDDLVLECSEGLKLLAPDRATVEALGDQPISLAELGALRRTALASNGHVITPPNRASTLEGGVLTDDELATCLISGLPQYPMQTIEIAGREGLLVRRRALWSRRKGLYRPLCETLNQARRLPFAELEAQLAGAVQPEALRALIRRLHELGGVGLERG